MSSTHWNSTLVTVPISPSAISCRRALFRGEYQVPWGEVLAQRDQEPGVVLADLDPGRLSHLRTQLPALEHRVL